MLIIDSGKAVVDAALVVRIWRQHLKGMKGWGWGQGGKNQVQKRDKTRKARVGRGGGALLSPATASTPASSSGVSIKCEGEVHSGRTVVLPSYVTNQLLKHKSSAGGGSKHGPHFPYYGTTIHGTLQSVQYNPIPQ